MKSHAIIAVALSWDGSRLSAASLPAAARAFLRGKLTAIPAPPATTMARLFSRDAIQEIRVCWVPILSGGNNTLAAPFLTHNGTRSAFRMTRSRRFGVVLGAVYRRVQNVRPV